MVSPIMKKFLALEKRVEALENNKYEGLAPHGQRLQQIADFIMSQFANKVDEVPITKIRKAGKAKGFSTQMLSRARRELLDDKIQASIRPGHGWTWYKIKKR